MTTATLTPDQLRALELWVVLFALCRFLLLAREHEFSLEAIFTRT